MFISAIGNSQSFCVQNQTQNQLTKTNLHNADNAVSFKAGPAKSILGEFSEDIGKAFKNLQKRIDDEFISKEEIEKMDDEIREKEAKRAEENWIRS